VAHSVCYVIDVPGAEFNATCTACEPASEKDLATLLATGSLWQPRDVADVGWSVELTGVVTVVWLTTKYTQLREHSSVAKRVLDWERIVLSPFLERRIVRMDELLLTKWEDIAGEWWFRDHASAERLWQWARSEEPESWSIRSSPLASI